MRRLIPCVAMAALLGGLGCGGSAPNPVVVTTNDMLDDLKGMLTEYQSDRKVSPKKLSDLATYEPVHQAALHGLSTGTCTYFWGSDLSGGQAVLAFETKAEKEGGYVLLQDGTIKKMTAAEFAAAPKAGKK